MYGYGFSLFLTNRAILAKANAGTPPSNTVAPLVTGSVSVGSTLTTTMGTWTGTPVITYTYQWKRGVSNIVGATNSSYILQAADVGQSIKCTVTATNAFGSAAADSNAIIATWEADAQAFITAAAITDPTQQSAINTLVTDLKGYGIWSKMKAIYPFVGGTASQHKWNLKDPRDLNAAYRLVFSGGWTHSANGALPNGTNAFADTFLNNNVLAQNSNHISAYSRTNSNTASTIIASFSGTFGISIYPRQFDAIYFNNNSTTQSSLSNIDSRGFFLNTRRNSTQILFQKNSTQNTISNSSTTLITTSFKISKTGDFAGEYSNRELAFSSIGDGLTNTEAANFYTAVQTFQTTLNRQV